MQKWCPEPFDAASVLNAGMNSEFKSDQIDVVLDEDPRFEADHGFAPGRSLWDDLSVAEQTLLLNQARESLGAENEVKEEERKISLASEIEEIRAAYDARFDIWSQEFQAVQSSEREALAADAAGLAVAMARKIIRDTVEIDPGMVARTLETALYKIGDAHSLTVVLNPEDALWLETNPELKSRLRVTDVVSDRRIEKGGCRVRAGGREWDATISRQLDSLSALVEEAVEEWESHEETKSNPDRGDADAPRLG